MEQERQGQLQKFQEAVSYAYKDIRTLDTALTHRSFSQNTKTLQNNEMLEFLGDSVLGFVISAELYTYFSQKENASEGMLTKYKSILVRTENLASHAVRLGLGDLLHLSQGEEKTGGREKTGILADAFESVVGSLYVDGGIGAAVDFVTRDFQEDMAGLSELENTFTDYKTLLQERLQSESRTLPVYTLVDEQGPDHKKHFTVAVYYGEEFLASGEGPSKKAAQQEAAQKALLKLDGQT